MAANVENSKRTVSLTISERCNLNCVYCYEHNKTARDMTFEQAKSIIDSELKERKPSDYTCIDFFGGEPFLNFELIKRVYDYVTSFYKGKIHFFATTNGTLVHGEIQKWLLEKRANFSVGLSLDGTREAHNINRSDSFDDIDLDFFLKNYPNQNVKMTISEKSLPYLADSVKFLTELGFKVACNLAYMVDWLAPENKDILINQLDKLIDYYLDNPKVEKCTMFDFKLGVLERPSKNTQTVRKYCGTGTAMVCYDLDGNAYPCQLFSPLSAGDRAKKIGEINIAEEYEKSCLDEKCRDCYYLKICPMCMGSNYLSTDNLYKPDGTRCDLYKLIFAANAKLKALEWERGQIHFVDADDEQAILRSIVKIQQLQ